tara:strand:- start:28 stop:489 length:462 start_codon:yes stop_codon:yes gene_type:complete
MGKYYQGKFKPKNPRKYKGDPTNIIYRSGWELTLCQYFDKHPDIIEWSSEELVIPYRSPVDNRMHRYFTDFLVKRKDKTGKVQTIVIEVKPYKQTLPPDREKGFTTRGKPKKRYLTEVKTYAVNAAKWKAAREYCADRKWVFQIMTEKEIYGK